jgi:hypothetical protein
MRICPTLILGPTLLALSACAATTFSSTWKAPDDQALTAAGKTIAAIFVSGDERARHTAEDALANDLIARGAHGVPAYTLVPNEIRPDYEDTLVRLKNAGANEVVVMRIVAADKKPTVTMFGDSSGPGTHPAALKHFETLVSVETLVYSLDRNEPLWSGTSRTTNPQDIAQLVNEVAHATANEMSRQRLIAER